MIFPPPSDGNNSNRQAFSSPDAPENRLSLARQQRAKQQANKWFLILLGCGLILGVLLAFGVVKLLQDFGLTTKPNHPLRIEPYRN
ncbi:hypothetical protein [Synechocystis sp. LKSZ1]|uniref:hypothetical protein n=1 Tax=Synechocystis sp. LKSZ1 TaxID=3144951 RepID=UPI00336BC5BC